MSTAAALKLQDAGFNRQQVDALVDLIERETVTKADLIAAESHLENKIDRLEAKVDQIAIQLRAEIAQLRAEIAAIRTEVASSARLTHYIGGVAVTLLLAIALKVFFG